MKMKRVLACALSAAMIVTFVSFGNMGVGMVHAAVDIENESVTVEEKVVNLYQKDIVHILKLLKEIENNKDSLNYKIVYDSWDIAIYYNRKSYKINYYTDNAYVKELINLLIDISPIHVDLHGWS